MTTTVTSAESSAESSAGTPAESSAGTSRETSGSADELLDAGRLVDLLPPGSPARGGVAAANARFTRPLQVQVVGRPGVGRDTMARAVRDRLAVTTIGPGEAAEGAADADLWVLLLAGLPRPEDRAALSRLPADRTIVVLGKADTLGERDVALDLAHRSADVLGVSVVAVSQLLSCADVRDDEFDFLRAMVAAGEEMPSMSAEFLTPTGVIRDGSERLVRSGLLRRIDQSGIDLALAVLSGDPDAVRTATQLNRILHAAGHIGDLVAPIRERVARVRAWRTVEVRNRLEVIAAGGTDRDAVEHLLSLDGLARSEVPR
ncbi:hypothetical protein [Gordonia soli]|uniref:Uncharacterized protein n=1 Tax=Gordonia soli NBRC 108243 TaxID=1223545 RepID=M0QFH2_9ACTN|nr:hypothetical protein [Gordonia soli]GAC67209.1 hypothetical protein GS4_06_00550 [Gordonia soli NBRC 108243]